LLGLKDDYVQDGRVFAEPLFDWAVPQTLIAHRETLLRLGAAYKQLYAPFGEFAMETLKASTKALASGSVSDDSSYTTVEGQIQSLTAQRDTLAGQIKAALNSAAFAGKALNEQQAKGYIQHANDLIGQAAALAGS